MCKNVFFSDLDENSPYDFSELIPAILKNSEKINVNLEFQYLYLYRGEQYFVPDIIKNETIHFSNASSFEDPSDCIIPKDTYISFIKNKNPLVDAEYMYKELCELRDNTVISCLTSSNENNSMWIKYAENYKGICIQYDIYRFFYENEFSNSMPLLPVIYTNEAHKILDIAYRNKQLIFTPGIINLMVLCKTKKWSFEEEWRFFNRTENLTSPFFYCPISKIFTGPRFDENKIKDDILEEAHKKNIPIIPVQLDQQGNITIQE